MRHLKLSAFALILTWATANSSAAEKISDESFHKYSSHFVEFVTEKSRYAEEETPSYPVWARVMDWEFLKYAPNAKVDSEKMECNSQSWMAQVLNADGKSVSNSISEYLNRCDSQLRSRWGSAAITTYLTMMIGLKIHEYPYGRFVILHLPNGTQVKGFLAIKGDGKKRPLIVVRPGIFSNVTQFHPERFMFLQFFEQSPFNVLMLESNSGSESIFRNKTLAIGGFDEGIQNFLIGKTLQQSSEPLSQIIDGVHLAAMSMGGHGLLFASLLNSLESQKRNSVFQSALAYCPLVNFRDTMDFHLSQGIETSIFDYWTMNRLRGTKEIIPAVNENHFVKSLMAELEKSYTGPISFEPKLPFDEKMRRDQKKFWQANDFWPSYKNVKTPVLILATQTDPIVPFALNSERIANHYMDVSGSDMTVVQLKGGLHCNLPGSYLWKPMTSIAQAYFLRNGSFVPEKMQRILKLSKDEAITLKGQQFPPIFRIDSDTDPYKFRLQIQIKDSPRSFRELSFSYEDMGFSNSKLTDSKDMIERWMAQNLHFELSEVTDQGSELKVSWQR